MSKWLPSLLIACAVPTAPVEAAPSRHRPPPATPAPRADLAIVPARALTLDEVRVQLWRPELRPPWRDPTAEETAAIETLVPELLRAAAEHTIDPGALALAGSVRMRIERWDVAGRSHLVLSELPDQRRGAGAYVFSLDAPVRGAPWILWEAPHAYFDLNTGLIAAQLFFVAPPGPRPAAFFTNTLHRYTQADGRRVKQANNPADAAHNPAHLLSVATLAAARTFPGATVIQLHGFTTANDDPDDDPIPTGTRAVVSAGDERSPTPLSSIAADRLRAVLGGGVLLFPADVHALGATTNVEKRGLTAIDGARFLHVETSDSTRDLLVQDPSRRDAFGAALFTVALELPPGRQP